MKKRVLSLALCLVLVVGLFSGLTVNASAGRLDDLKKEIAEKLIKEKIEQLKEEFEIPDLDTEAIISSFTTAATEGDFGENSCLHWEVSTGVLSGKTLTCPSPAPAPCPTLIFPTATSHRGGTMKRWVCSRASATLSWRAS